MEFIELNKVIEASFTGWLFGFLIFFLILHIICRPPKTQKQSTEKWAREYKILHECGIFGIDLNKDHRLSGSPLLHCYTNDYQKAFDIILFDNQEKVSLNGEEYVFKRNIKAIKIFEQITNRRFNIEDDYDIYIFIYSLLLANNEDRIIRIDEFLTYAQKNEIKSSNKEKTKKGMRKRHVPSIFYNDSQGIM